MIDPPVSGPGRRAYPAKLPWYMDSMRDAAPASASRRMRAYLARPGPRPAAAARRMARTPATSARYWPASRNSNRRLPRRRAADQSAGHADDRRPRRRGAAGRHRRIARPAAGLRNQLRRNAGHMIPWDDEAGFYRAFGDFLGHRWQRFGLTRIRKDTQCMISDHNMIDAWTQVLTLSKLERRPERHRADLRHHPSADAAVRADRRRRRWARSSTGSTCRRSTPRRPCAATAWPTSAPRR